MAATYLRISAVGLPFALLAFSAQGILRGLASLRSPLLIVAGGNLGNAVLEVLFVYGFDWGIVGSAWSTVLAQAGMGVALTARVLGRGMSFAFGLDMMRRLLRLGSHIFVRTSALHLAILVSAAVIARFGDASIAAHRIVFSTWGLLALFLDAVAIAGQVIVSRRLGAEDANGALAAASRTIGLTSLLGVCFAVSLLALASVIPDLFTGDPLVLEKARSVWPILVVALPISAAVYALDGVLIGAGDVGFLMRAMLLSAAVCVIGAVAALGLGLCIFGVWLAFLAMNAVRLVTLGVRYLRREWLVIGWA